MGINVYGVFNVCWVFILCMWVGGLFINIGLIFGMVVDFFMVFYNVFKVFVYGFICFIVVDYGFYIWCNVICLGWIEIGMLEVGFELVGNFVKVWKDVVKCYLVGWFG